MYGKLENNNLVIAPKKLIINNTQVWNASAEEYLAQGWYPVVFSSPPYESPIEFEWESTWALEEGQIIQEWTLIERELDDSELLNILLGGEDDG